MSQQAYQVTRQIHDILPPRKGQIINIGVVAGLQVYDFFAIPLASFKDDSVNGQPQFMYITMQAEGGDIYFYWSPDAVPVLNFAAAVPAGNPITLPLPLTFAYRLPQNQIQRYRINRIVDRYLHMQTSAGTATLRLYASSIPNIGSIQL